MKYTVFGLLALTVFVVSCTTQQTGDLTDPYIGGTQGLAMSFMDGMPPREIFDDGRMPFSVGVLIENLGESEVGNAVLANRFAGIEIIGINPAQFTPSGQGTPDMEKYFGDSDIRVVLPAARRTMDGTIVAGGKNTISFQGFSYSPDERGNSEVTLRANICYNYETYTNTKVCIKDNVLENTQDSTICTLSGQKDVKNSGAPVHVTSITENPMGSNKIQVTFTIENVGTGQIFRQVTNTGSVSGSCDTSQMNPNKNYVKVHVYLGDGRTAAGDVIECPMLGVRAHEGFIQLFQGNSVTMVCTILTNENGNRIYTDTFHVDLGYAYLQYIETPLLIRDVSN